MAPEIHHIRIFLSSPSDVAEERDIARELIKDALPVAPFIRDRATFDIVSCDDPHALPSMPVHLTPQQAIDKKLKKPSECDVVIVILWNRMGTPLSSELVKDDGTTYQSGTEWEFEDALKAAKKIGKPEILLYRRTEISQIGLDDPDIEIKREQYHKVEAFFAQFQDADGSLKGSFYSYTNPEEFRDLLRQHLESIVSDLIGKEATPNLESSMASDVDQSDAENEQSGPCLHQTSQTHPYRGLSVFSEDHSEFFFGRDKIIDRAISQYTSLHNTMHDIDNAAFLAIVGPSGSGKSSFARAGLIPKIRSLVHDNDASNLIVILSPGTEPVHQLALALAKQVLDDPKPIQRSIDLAELLRRKDSSGHYYGLSMVLKEISASIQSHFHLLIDQFEEVYSLCEDQEGRDTFIAILLDAVCDPNSNISVLITLRTDFFNETQQHAKLNDLICKQNIILPVMSEAELREIIVEPARIADRELDEPTVTRLVNETKNLQDALPLLEFVLTRIWICLTKQGAAPAKTVGDLGGVRNALATEAEEIFDSLPEDLQICTEQVFLKLIWFGKGPLRDTLKRVLISELVRNDNSDQVDRVLKAFSEDDRCLIQYADDRDQGQPTARICHKALLEHWERLQNWVENARRFHQRLSYDAQRWNTGEAIVWQKTDFQQLEDFYNHHQDQMEDIEVQFYLHCKSSDEEETKKINKLRNLETEKIVALNRKISKIQSVSSRLKVLSSLMILMVLIAIPYYFLFKKSDNYIIATGSLGGNYINWGAILSSEFNSNENLNKISSVPSEGSLDNLLLLQNNEAQLGIVQSELLLCAKDKCDSSLSSVDIGNLRIIAHLPHEFAHFLVRKKKDIQYSGNTDDLEKVKDVSIYLGSAGSGAFKSNVALLKILGHSVQDFNVDTSNNDGSARTYMDAAKLFITGELHAIIVPGSIPLDAISNIAKQLPNDYILLDVNDEGIMGNAEKKLGSEV